MKYIFILLIPLSLLFMSCSEEEDSVNNNSVNNNLDLSIGDVHEGGVVFFLEINGDHGLVCDFSDLSSNGFIEWGPVTTLVGVFNQNIGSGNQNTLDILSFFSAINPDSLPSNTAAIMCDNHTAQGYSDWYLPSLDELNQMYLHKETLQLTNGFVAFKNDQYWSSSEADYTSVQGLTGAYWIDFEDGYQQWDHKSDNRQVRAIRSF